MMIPQDVEEAACAGRLAKGEAAARQSAQVSSRAAVRFSFLFFLVTLLYCPLQFFVRFSLRP